MPKTSRIDPNNFAKPAAISDDLGIGWDYLDLDDSLRVSVYGAPATGKTTFASTFPGPILWLICSGGNKPGELRSINTTEMRKKIFPKTIRSLADAMNVLEYAKKTGNYETIVMDHVTGLQDLAIMETLNMKEAPLQIGRSNAQKDKGMTVITQQEWGFIGVECKKPLREMLSLSCHSVIVAQERRTDPESKEGNKPFSEIEQAFVGVAVTPTLAGWINSSTDFILHAFKQDKYIEKRQETKNKNQPVIITRTKVKGKASYCVHCGHHNLFLTKFRIPREFADNLPEYIVNPTYDKMVAITNGKDIGTD